MTMYFEEDRSASLKLLAANTEKPRGLGGLHRKFAEASTRIAAHFNSIETSERES